MKRLRQIVGGDDLPIGPGAKVIALNVVIAHDLSALVLEVALARDQLIDAVRHRHGACAALGLGFIRIVAADPLL